MMFEKSCIVCGTSFLSKSNRSLYCSDQCSSKQQYVRNKMQGKFKCICPICDENFTSTKASTVYCSIACANKKTHLAGMLKLNYIPIEKKCPCCKNLFVGKKMNKYCSIPCRNKMKWQRQPKICLTCKGCFQIFESKNSEASFCSDTCAKKNMHSSMPPEQKEQWRSKIGTSNSGKKRSEEQKQKYKEMFSGKGNPRWQAVVSKETKEKISNGLREYFKFENGPPKLYGFKKGIYLSTKTNHSCIFRSSWEEKAFISLDQNFNVLDWISEPFSIPYLFEDITKNYIPDLLITYKDGRKLLVEIKPECFISHPINQAKFQAAKEYCEAHGMQFELWFEDAGIFCVQNAPPECASSTQTA